MPGTISCHQHQPAHFTYDKVEHTTTYDHETPTWNTVVQYFCGGNRRVKKDLTTGTDTIYSYDGWQCIEERELDGHTWGPHLSNALIYVERNPVRARILRRAWDYPWSSAAAHVGAADATGLLDLRAWRTRHDEDDWRERLQRREDDDLLAAIRLTTHRGRPLASDKFISKLESTLGRRLRPLPGGRPRKQ